MFKRKKKKRRFSFSDLSQQIVGGFLVAGPFVVTEEVWKLATNIEWYHSLLATFIVFSIGYGALYKADEHRNLEKEVGVGVVPLRFLSLMIVSYLSVTILIFIFGARATFGASLLTTLKVITMVSVFSVIGAAAADSIFEGGEEKR